MKQNYLNSETNPDYPYDSYKSYDNIPCNVNIKFYRCDSCGRIMASIEEITNPLICCGDALRPLTPGTVDASIERHVPIYTRTGHKVIVTVGELEHPMLEAHHIEWICLVTNLGIQWHPLAFDDNPSTVFRVKGGEAVLAVYAYCNLHGLWCCQECT